MTGFLGRSNAGAFEELFGQKKIADHFVRIAGQTRIGIKITDPVRGETTDINFPGPAPSRGGSRDASRHRSPPSKRSGLSSPAAFRRESIRESIATRRGPAPAWPARSCSTPAAHRFRSRSTAQPTAIKPNIHEFEDYLGRSLAGEKEVVAAARELIARGVELVVVSMGKEGACFVTPNEAVIAQPPDIEVKSTVGAGDAMVAGILSGQLQKLSLGECARLATAFSIDSLSRLESGLSSRSAIEAAMQKVAVTQPS